MKAILSKYSNTLIIIVAVVTMLAFIVPNVVFGIDVRDAGFHLVAYDNVFTAPNSVSYNFMYYLTNVIGGAIMTLFPTHTLLAMKCVGAICLIGVWLFVYYMLRDQISWKYILLGAVLFFAGFIRRPYCFDNMIATTVFNVVACLVLYRGITRKISWQLVLAGFLIGMNCFTRLPNVLMLGLVMVVLLVPKLINGRTYRCDWSSSLLFVLGVTLGLVMILFLIHSLGHVGAFKDGVMAVFSKSGDGQSHSIYSMIFSYGDFYMKAIAVLLLGCGLFLLIDKLPIATYCKWGGAVILMLWLLIYIYWYYSGANYISGSPSYFLWAMCLAGCLLAIKTRNEKSTLALIAIYVMLVQPLGSNMILNHACMPFIVALPIAAAEIINRRRLLFVVTFIVATLLLEITQGVFGDIGPLRYKSSTINVPELSNTRTTSHKSEVIKSALNGLADYISAGDTLISFPDAPMMNYLTHTKPAGGMCWPSTNAFFVTEIVGKPYIIVSKFASYDAVWQTNGVMPEDIRAGLETLLARDDMRDGNYAPVWENDYFVLYAPASKRR